MMACPYADPTVEQCLNCPLPDCEAASIKNEKERKRPVTEEEGLNKRPGMWLKRLCLKM